MAALTHANIAHHFATLSRLCDVHQCLYLAVNASPIVFLPISLKSSIVVSLSKSCPGIDQTLLICTLSVFDSPNSIPHSRLRRGVAIVNQSPNCNAAPCSIKTDFCVIQSWRRIWISTPTSTPPGTPPEPPGTAPRCPSPRDAPFRLEAVC